MDEHDQRSGSTIVCGECGKRVKRKSLGSHISDMHTSNPLQHICRICSSRFKRSYHLNRHINSVHVSPSLTTKHSCGVCGKEYTRKSNLTHHITTRHGSSNPKECKMPSNSLMGIRRAVISFNALFIN